jgi:NADH-quinone oxidoreductase subunit F
MSEIDLKPLQNALAPLARQGRTALLPALYAAQEIFGYIPEPAAAAVAHALHVPLADVWGVIDFYSLFYKEPVGKTVIHVCNDPACAMAGADGVLKMMTQKMEPQNAGHASNLTVERAPCLGLCEYAPAMLIQGDAVASSEVAADHQTWENLVAGRRKNLLSFVAGDIHLLTANCGRGFPTSLEEYRQGGGYRALQKALAMPSTAVIEEVKASGLVGRGGAAFPTGLKWESTANAPGMVRYVVCNADEAEPGTFKDRILLEDDPHRLLEGLMIAAYAVGAQQGYVYIRGEYLRAYRVLQKALEQARQAGILGNNILGSSFSFEVELRRGAGAYICGEETALFESIEGKRGFPRIKPPFPTTHGLFGMPTAINNVETLCNVPLILMQGAAAYRQIGTEKSPGPKLFCISGDVLRPGLYEVPFGVSLRRLVFELAGGMRPERTFQAALIGGAAGAFATPEQLDTPLTFEHLRAAGLPLGSGVITVFDHTRDLRDIVVRLTRFFADESCGKCYPCQLGTRRQHEIMQRIARGGCMPQDIERLQLVGWTMADSSLCGLGQAAASAVLSAVKHWPELFQAAEAAHD